MKEFNAYYSEKTGKFYKEDELELMKNEEALVDGENKADRFDEVNQAYKEFCLAEEVANEALEDKAKCERKFKKLLKAYEKDYGTIELNYTNGDHKASYKSKVSTNVKPTELSKNLKLKKKDKDELDTLIKLLLG